jgi:flagellar biosynthesis/type III secretory pathway chaperone
MSTDWKTIADLLRHEMSEYGALLSLYDQQQRGLLSRQPETVLRLSSEIQAQVERVGESRRRRETAAGAFAVALGLRSDATLRSMIPLVERDAQPLLEALVSEINLTLHRVRRTHRQNHTLLSKALAMHRETLQLLRPNSFIRTYSPAGRVTFSSSRAPSTLCAAG